MNKIAPRASKDHHRTLADDAEPCLRDLEREPLTLATAAPESILDLILKMWLASVQPGGCA